MAKNSGFCGKKNLTVLGEFIYLGTSCKYKLIQRQRLATY